MYEVEFYERGSKVNENYVKMTIQDLERALALASLLQKISTPEVQFGDIQVKPYNLDNNETQEN